MSDEPSTAPFMMYRCDSARVDAGQKYPLITGVENEHSFSVIIAADLSRNVFGRRSIESLMVVGNGWDHGTLRGTAES